MHSLPLFVKLAGRPVILLGQGDAADAKRRLLERAGAAVMDDESAAASLAIVAIEDEGEALAAVQRLKARGVLVNAVDRPALCDFTLPAIVDRSPVLIAIGTGGASAGLAKMLRQKIEVLLPSTVGALATALSQARVAMKQRWKTSDERRRALDVALAAGGVLDPLGGADAAAVELWLGSDDTQSQGRLEIVRLISSDPDELTLRVARLLGEADVIYYHPDVPDAILHRARADAVRVPATTMPVNEGAGLMLWLTMEREQ
jgi:uroporphyrin-III C-methyltransferase / precorrin-2 dehydrogenase / sirohydrochlorin ferrochelatase